VKFLLSTILCSLKLSTTKFILFLAQIAKLCMIPASCLLEVVFDHVHYSRDTKLSIMVVLIGVAVCTVTDVSVNARGLIAAVIAVWSTALQQYVSFSTFVSRFLIHHPTSKIACYLLFAISCKFVGPHFEPFQRTIWHFSDSDTCLFCKVIND